jgi:hypothetical protein
MPNNRAACAGHQRGEIGDGYAALRPWHHTAGGRTCRLRLAFQICCPTFPEPRPGKRGESTTRVKRWALIRRLRAPTIVSSSKRPHSPRRGGDLRRGATARISRDAQLLTGGGAWILTAQRLVRRDDRCKPALAWSRATDGLCLFESEIFFTLRAFGDDGNPRNRPGQFCTVIRRPWL